VVGLSIPSSWRFCSSSSLWEEAAATSPLQLIQPGGKLCGTTLPLRNVLKSSRTNRVPEFCLAARRLHFTKRNLAAHSAAMPKIIFVRHGQAAHNVAFESLGSKAYEDPRYRDSKLTQTGTLAYY
jgi:hypothetical protein